MESPLELSTSSWGSAAKGDPTWGDLRVSAAPHRGPEGLTSDCRLGRLPAGVGAGLTGTAVCWGDPGPLLGTGEGRCPGWSEGSLPRTAPCPNTHSYSGSKPPHTQRPHPRVPISMEMPQPPTSTALPAFPESLCIPHVPLTTQVSATSCAHLPSRPSTLHGKGRVSDTCREPSRQQGLRTCWL